MLALMFIPLPSRLPPLTPCSNKDKTVEPWLLHTFDADFYGADIRLSLVAYIRPEVSCRGFGAEVAPYQHQQ
jgi:riboflavin kinase